MPPRSRRAANELAMQHLQKDSVSDDDILAVLRLWYFKQNKTRANVTPEGSTSVFSDNLGLVKSRVGSVLCSNATVKNLAVLILFSRWLAEHLPACFQMLFPFSRGLSFCRSACALFYILRARAKSTRQRLREFCVRSSTAPGFLQCGPFGGQGLWCLHRWRTALLARG